MNCSHQLASYAHNLRFEDLPPDVIEQAKRLTLHVIGVSVAGRRSKQGGDAVRLALAMGGESSEATIWGERARVSASQAAFANGTLADVLDWEDCCWTGHPSAGAIPAAFAAAERARASGRDYLTAIVAGYEVYQRIAMAVQPTPAAYLRMGWGLTCWQIFAASIPAAKLLLETEQQMRQSIGIAAMMTPVVNRHIQLDRSDLYHYQHGLTSRDGIVAADIAGSGINGLESVLDGDHGYWVSVSDQCDWDWMTRDLGARFLILETLFKRWPVNMWVQQFMDMVDDIRRTERFEPADIVSIMVSPNFQKTAGASRMIKRPEGFLSTTDAQFSIPFCIAKYLLDPVPSADWFSPQSMRDPATLALAAKVDATGEMTSPFDAFALFQAGDYIRAAITIALPDGRALERKTHFPKGHPRNRMNAQEESDLFRVAAAGSYDARRIERIIATILRLEEEKSLQELASLLRA